MQTLVNSTFMLILGYATLAFMLLVAVAVIYEIVDGTMKRLNCKDENNE
jgi:hypothetical protein